MATEEHAHETDGSQVRVLARGLTILKAFTPHNRWLSNQQIAELAALPKPTVSRLTAVLTTGGYLTYSRKLAQYRLTPSVATLGFGGFVSLDVPLVARPLLDALARETDGLTVLATRNGLSMICNEVHHGPHILSLRLRAGSRLPLPRSAMGRALLGSLPEAERNALLKEIRTAFRADWPRLDAELATAPKQIATQGFVTTIGTTEESINGVGAVINTPRYPNVYVLGCAAPASRFPAERLSHEIGPRLVDVRCEIERQLGSRA
jgi:DNA-binding IclR family transcriptional regulator